MSLACQRCKLSTNGPQAFLLTCRACSKTWHHRCHQPAIEDEELIRRIRATNAGDTLSGNDLHSWTCRRCNKKSASATPSVSSREPTADVKRDQTEPATSPARDATPVFPQTHSRSTISTVVTASYEDIEMDVDVPAPTLSSHAVSSQAASDDHPIDSSSVARALTPARATSPSSAKERLPQIDQDDDDPEDLYGPPVERRVIRILPSLAEELREQQQRRRTPAEKERRTPLATDWISARHAQDPSWKPILSRTDGQRKRKPVAKRLGDNGLNVDGLLACFTADDWLREHRA